MGRSLIDKGRHGEEIAARFLALCGVTVLQRNVRLADVEIDLVGREDDRLVLVEVKLRGAGIVGARAALGWRQERRLLRAAQASLAGHAWATAVRIDVVAIDVDPSQGTLRLEHLRGALPR